MDNVFFTIKFEQSQIMYIGFGPTFCIFDGFKFVLLIYALKLWYVYVRGVSVVLGFNHCSR